MLMKLGFILTQGSPLILSRKITEAALKCNDRLSGLSEVVSALMGSRGEGGRNKGGEVS